MALQIDGSHGEGGGQILRTALSLASLLQRHVEIIHIRRGRATPGLRPQHLMVIKALAAVTAARVEGNEIGSQYLYFEPHDLRPGQYTFDIGTAGSIGLVLQAVLPVVLKGKVSTKITIIGGTHVAWSPCFHYLKKIFLPALHDMGIDVSLEIKRWGWYPKGGGEITASITPVQKFAPLELLERGRLCKLYLLSALSNLPLKIGERQRDQALDQLGKKNYLPETELIQAPSPGQGTVVFIECAFEKGFAGFTSLGKRGKPAEQVAKDACNDFFKFINTKAAVDEHLADQLLSYMALADGRSTFITSRITPHLRTNAWVIEQFLPLKFDIEETTGKIEVEGIAQ